MKDIKRRGIMLVLSSPSGAGKTTIAKKLLELEPELAPSISVTTRPPRPGEMNGQDYLFVTPGQFNEMIQKGELLEHAEVFGYSYGTPKKRALDTLISGKDIIFDIDWQGTQQLAQIARSDLISVFILPPSTEELERRLKNRAQDEESVVERRMAEAATEMSHWAEYDYVIVNRDLTLSVAQIQAILTAERLRRTRQSGVVDFVHELRHSSES
ncbi:MAG: guanylate kinase [Alphaproteobacteria bacterium]|jgi:guanylate kinase|nr:guanylate kinase [Alphaproteobacteria bacterium]